MNEITALTVNYNTPDFLDRLLSSFRKHYQIKFIIVDGSDDEYYEQISDFPDKYNIELHHFPYNIHHGPGLAYGFDYIKTKQILILDSDLIVVNPGFVEDFKEKLKPDSYGIGDIQIVDKNGFNRPTGINYLHPACTLINREVIMKFPMPIKHGAPMIEAMKEINRQKLSNKILQHEPWVTNDFRKPDKKYIIHDWQGTVTRTGGYHI